MRSTDNRPLTGRALEAVASPARLEIMSALGDGPKTTRELAQQLGRSRQALYHHLGLLAQAGLVAAEPPAEGEREQRFRLKTERVAISARRDSATDGKARAKAIQAILRHTAREASAALQNAVTRSGGALREVVGVRGKARLTKPQLKRANELIDQLVALLAEAKGGSATDPLYAVTLVLTPAREAGRERG